MNEKQRWLLKDLDEWKENQFRRIGKYGPKKSLPEPSAVKAARVVRARADKIIQQWEHKDKNAPWNKQKAAIDLEVQGVKRAILFEKTADALKALKALKP